MRLNLTFFILLGILTQVSANGFSQITIKASNIPLKEVVKQIEKQSGYVFMMYDDTDLLKAKVSLDLYKASIEEALYKGFKETGISYSIVEKNVLLKREQVSVINRFQSVFKIKRDLDFKLVDDDGQTLFGASLKVKPSNIIYKSDEKGFFHLRDIADDAILEISYVGYETAIILAANVKKFVSLKKMTTKLEEVIINKGYYTTTQKLNTGSAVQITSKDIEGQPLTNPITALQGLVTGMYIKQGSGVSGASNTIQIRGRSSINSGTAPLYILDGVPFSGVSVDRQIGSNAMVIGGQPNGSTDPMNVINPADIESITVLKDADATAIYGSRGSNGVVLITTKKAKPGLPSLKVNVQRSFGKVVNQMDLLPLNEYLAIRRKAFENDARTPTAAIAPDLVTWDQNNSSNLQDLLIGNTSKITDLTSSLSLGTVKSSMLISGTYHDETSILYGGSGFTRGTMNMSASTSAADDRLKLGVGANLSFGKNNMPGLDFTAALYNIPKNFPLYTPNGELNWVSNFSNPIAVSRQVFQNDSKNMNLNGSISYRIIPELTFRTTFGYNNISQTQSYQLGASTVNPLNTTPVSRGYYTNSNTEIVSTESQFDYSKQFGKHNLNLSAGGTWQGTNYDMPYLIGADTFAAEALLGSFTNAANFTLVRALDAENKYLSFFGRANYNFEEKYVVNATVRRDGSSRFGPNKKFGTFASIGAAWIFSDESFLKSFTWLNFGKLRTSYGVTGNDQSDNYGYSDTYTSTSSSYGGNPGFYPTRIANPTFSWESNRKFEIAMELGFLGDRIRFTPAFFRNRSDNMVVRSTPLPAQTGFTTYTANMDALVQNQGFELDLRVRPVQTKEIKWELTINFTQSKNKLMSLPSTLTSLYANTYQVGQPLSTFTGYRFLGFQNGVAQFEDRTGDGTITSGLTGDYFVLGQRDPAYYGGFTSGISYKRFRLDALFNFTKQKANIQIGYPGAFGSQLQMLSSSPFIPSTTTTGASYASYSRYSVSDGVLSDASYIRLRNLSLNYALQENWVKKIKLTQAQVFLRGQNLWTITNYKGLDPETQTSVLPPLKMFIIGLSCSF